MPTELPPPHSIVMPQIDKIVSSYLKHNRLSSSESASLRAALHQVFSGHVPAEMHSKHTTSLKVENLVIPEPPEAQQSFMDLIKQPAIPIADSIQPDFIICLEDGAAVKSLAPYIKRHFAMTPKQYREKWGLPADYPMAPPVSVKKRGKAGKAVINEAPSTSIPDQSIDAAATSSPDAIIAETGNETFTGEPQPIHGDIQQDATVEVTPPPMAIPEPAIEKPVHKPRPILKLAAWQKPPVLADKAVEPETKIDVSAAAAPEEKTQDEEPAVPQKAAKPPQENSRGFRYPVHRYSR